MQLFLQAARSDQPGDFFTAAGSVTSADRRIIRLEQESITDLQRNCRPPHKKSWPGSDRI